MPLRVAGGRRAGEQPGPLPPAVISDVEGDVHFGSGGHVVGGVVYGVPLGHPPKVAMG